MTSLIHIFFWGLKKTIMAGMLSMTFLACEGLIKDINAEAREVIVFREEEGE